MGTGTEASPFKSHQNVGQLPLKPGDRVCFRVVRATTGASPSGPAARRRPHRLNQLWPRPSSTVHQFGFRRRLRERLPYQRRSVIVDGLCFHNGPSVPPHGKVPTRSARREPSSWNKAPTCHLRNCEVVNYPVGFQEILPWTRSANSLAPQIPPVGSHNRGNRSGASTGTRGPTSAAPAVQRQALYQLFDVPLLRRRPGDQLGPRARYVAVRVGQPATLAQSRSGPRTAIGARPNSAPSKCVTPMARWCRSS